MNPDSELYKAFVKFKLLPKDDSDDEEESDDTTPILVATTTVVNTPINNQNASSGSVHVTGGGSRVDPTPQITTNSPPQITTNSSPQITTNSSPQITTNSSPQITTISTPPIISISTSSSITMVECAYCTDEVPASEIKPTRCCNLQICAGCFDSGLFLDLTNGQCASCKKELTMTIYSDVMSGEQLHTLRKFLARKYEGGWINCTAKGCSGGGAVKDVKEGHFKCETCGTVICANCAQESLPGYGHSHLGMSCEEYRFKLSQPSSTSSSSSLSVSTSPSPSPSPSPSSSSSSSSLSLPPVSEDEEYGWMGTVQCPYCGAKAQRDGGCDVLKCGNPKCGKQYRADGDKSLEHSSTAGAFDKAMSTFSARSTLKQVEELFQQHPKMAGLFKLPQLVQRLSRAKENKDAETVQGLCDRLLANGIMRGLRECLLALFMPASGAEEEFYRAVSRVATLGELHHLLAHTAPSDFYPDIVADTGVLLSILERKVEVPFALVGLCNKIKNARIKSLAKLLIEKASF